MLEGLYHQLDLSYILWVCPNLQGYWEDVKKEIVLILDTKLNLHPMLFILGIPLGN